jgi:predicted lipoprotein with Yx(FWY)xxD motif
MLASVLETHMRKTTLVGLALAAALTASAAFAQDLPAGVKRSDGVLTDPAGKPLYTFVMDTMKGMSHCTGPCATAWPPFVAARNAKPAGDWTLVTREDGAQQWAYKDKPLYTFAKDEAGKPGAGEAATNWKLAR